MIYSVRSNEGVLFLSRGYAEGRTVLIISRDMRNEEEQPCTRAFSLR